MAQRREGFLLGRGTGPSCEKSRGPTGTSFQEEDATLTLPSSLRVSPGHDCCETVKVQLCASKEGVPVFVVAEEDFEFVQDEAYDAAQFLATSAGNQQALNFTRFLDRSGPPSADVNALDEKVALAFRHLKLPAEWNVLGTEQTLHGEHANGPQTDGERGPLGFFLPAVFTSPAVAA